MGRLSAGISGGEAATGYGAKSTNGPRIEVSMSSNLEHVLRGLDDLAKYQKKHRDKVRAAHKLVALSGRRKLKKGIQDYHRDIVVKRRNSEITIPRGTLKKSIKVFRPKDDQTNWWLGPKTGILRSGKIGAVHDGWFAHFVEGGSSPFLQGRKNRNYRWFERSRPGAVSNMQRNLHKQHGKLLKEIYGAK